MLKCVVGCDLLIFDVVDVVVFSGVGEVKEVIKRSKLPKLLEQVKATFPNTTLAHTWANAALDKLGMT